MSLKLNLARVTARVRHSRSTTCCVSNSRVKYISVYIYRYYSRRQTSRRVYGLTLGLWRRQASSYVGQSSCKLVCMCECGVTRFCVYINWKVQAYRPRGRMAMTCCCLHSIGLLGNHISWMEIRWLLLGRCLASNESVDVDNVMMGFFVYMVLRPLIAFSSPCFFFSVNVNQSAH